MTASSTLRSKLRPVKSISNTLHHHMFPRTQNLGQRTWARLISHPPTTALTATHKFMLPAPQKNTHPTHPFNSRRPFMSSTSQSTPAQDDKPQPPTGEDWEMLSPEAKIQWCGEDKWGFIVYRCSHSKVFDGGWDDFKRRIERMRQAIATESDAPGIAEKLDFVFVEDPTLEGASIQELQRRFQAWARENNPGVDLDNDQIMSRGARYEFFLRVDGEGVWGGYVSLVRGWPLTPGEEDWMKIRPSSVGPELYFTLGNPETWYAYYWPPESGLSCTGW